VSRRSLLTPGAALRRLFTLVPTKQEVKALLDHVDSPYIRAVRARPLLHTSNPSQTALSAAGRCACNVLVPAPDLAPSQIGFLYLRYVGSPRTLWDWVQPYVRDSEVRRGKPARCVKFQVVQKCTTSTGRHKP